MKKHIDGEFALWDIKPETCAFIQENSKMIKIEKDIELFTEKDEIDGIYIAVKGSYSIYKTNYIGDKKAIFVLGEGDILNGYTGGMSNSAIGCTALSSGRVLFVSKSIWEKAVSDDFDLAKKYMAYQEKKIQKLYRQLKNMTGSVRGDKRLAAKLWKLSRDYGVESDGGVEIRLPLTVTYMAELIGAKRETTSRQLKRLTEEGLLLHRGNKITILSRDRLREYIFSEDV